MKRYILFLLCFPLVLNASDLHDFADDTAYSDTSRTNSAILNLTGSPNTVVGGCVSVISGDYLDHECDLVLGGNDPLTFERHYSSSDHRLGSLFNSWFHNHHAYVKINRYSPLHDSYLYDEGQTVAFQNKIECTKWFSVSVYQDQFKNGYTNCSGGEISSRTNLRNLRLDFGDEGKKIEVNNGAHEVQTFYKGKHKETYFLKFYKKANLNGIWYWLEDDTYVKRITAYNSKSVGTGFLKLDFPLTTPLMRKNPRMIVESNDDRNLVYHFKYLEGDKGHKVKKHRFLLTQVERPNAPNVSYTYDEPDSDSLERIICKSLPEKRDLHIEYYRHKGVYEVNGRRYPLTSRKNANFNMVYRLKAPVGHDSTPLTTYTFFYSLGHHKEKPVTSVYDAYNYLTSYSFDHETDRLQSIAKYDQHNNLYLTESFYWIGDYLKTRTLSDNNNNILYCRTYNYASQEEIGVYGNIASEKVYGNLTGNNQIYPIIDRFQFVDSKGCESYKKTYTYLKKRGLLSVEADLKHEIQYHYLSDKDLVTKKFIVEGDTIRFREFTDYDENAAPTLIITDNGSSQDKDNVNGVTSRIIQEIINTNTYPCGLPISIRECYRDFENNCRVLLKKTLNSYDNWGRLLKQQIYDSQDSFAYELTWEYDNYGNVTRETNALGQETIRRFDINGNKVFEQGPNLDSYLEFVYDFSNRLIRQDEVFTDGTRHSATFVYDLKSNKIAETDMYGNTTRYVYDAFGRMIKTILPPVPNDKGQHYNPVLTFEYDEFNNLASATDAAGNTTKTKYTLHGKPYYIENPDGTIQRFEYEVNGELLKEIAPDGSYTLFTNDFLSRPTEIKKYDAEGNLLQTTLKQYEGSNLQSETGPSGITTYYKYDFAGRLATVISGDSKTTFSYDSLGRVCEERSYFGSGESDYISKKTKYDLLDRTIEESQEDSQGNIQFLKQYAYDASGNKSLITVYNDAGASSLFITYDTLKNPIHVEDALHNITHTIHDYTYIDKHGIGVPYTETIDALGTITISIGDALGRMACVMKKNTLGVLVEKTEFSYDALGNKVARKDTVIANHEIEREVFTRWEYDANGLVTTIIEAEGTPDQRASRFEYDEFGRITHYVKPDGVSIIYSYDALGRMKEHKTSDGSFGYTFQYDQFDHPIQIDDTCHMTKTMREYDEQGRMKRETLANGLTLDFDIDALGRTTSLHYPDGSSTLYNYKGAYVSDITRLDPSGSQKYQHEYKAYDLSGNCTQAKLIGSAGTLHTSYDLLNRTIKIESPDWKEETDSYDCVGNLLKIKLTDPVGECVSRYTYDDLYQLASEQGWISHDYVNDSLSNQVQKDGYRQSFNSLNQLLESEKGTFVYDLNGNLIRKNCEGVVTEFRYDALNRLIEVVTPEKTYKYEYDSFNRRISKSNGENLTRHIYVGIDEVGSVDENGKILELRVLGIGKGSEIGAAISVEIGENTYAPIHDHNGSITALKDALTGQIFENYRYSAFGEESCYDCSGQKTPPSNPWRFSSKRNDPETGLIYFGERYYDPTTSRWMTNDPLGFEAGPNLYAYVHNRPLSLFDQYGLSARGDGFLDYLQHVSFSENVIEAYPDYPDRLVNSSTFYPLRPLEGSVGRFVSPNFRVLYMPGMNNKFLDVTKSSKMISDLMGGAIVHFIWTPTGGPSHDCGRYFLTRWHDVDSWTAQQFRESVYDYFAHASPDAFMLVIDHSEGCVHSNQGLKNLPPELRDRIIVRSFGPSYFIDPDICHSVVHYCSKWHDVVHCANPSGMIKHWETVRFLDAPEGASWNEHGIGSITWREHLKRELDDYKSGSYTPKLKKK